MFVVVTVTVVVVVQLICASAAAIWRVAYQFYLLSCYLIDLTAVVVVAVCLLSTHIDISCRLTCFCLLSVRVCVYMCVCSPFAAYLAQVIFCCSCRWLVPYKMQR